MEAEVIRVVSAEQQAEIIRDRTGIMLPTLTGGKRRFFSDLLSDQTPASGRVGCVFPETQFGLVFATAGEVLASSMQSASAPSEAAISHQLTEFGLPIEKATQAVKSLSGGEQMLLTFAKLHAMRDRFEKLIACSPLHPLDPSNYQYWSKLSEAFSRENKAVTVIILEGEDVAGEVSKIDTITPPSTLPWQLSIRNPVLRFSEVQFPTFHPAFDLSYLSETDVVELISPTFVSGDNGIGKSAFCKALVGLNKIVKGGLGVHSPNGTGPGRLLFQEADEQLFGKSIDEHLHWAFRYDADRGKTAKEIYNAIESHLRDFLKDQLIYASSLGDPAKPSTELQTKIALAAERIASKPSVLILDEPSRKLCRPLATRLVVAICEQAHKQNVPVLIISHMAAWWAGIAQSNLVFRRVEQGSTKIELET
jgi:energy-coupling factor transporter ATP-binding protein EcfA2